MFQKKPKLESRKPWKFKRWISIDPTSTKMKLYDDWGWMEIYSDGSMKEVLERPTDKEIKNRNLFQ